MREDVVQQIDQCLNAWGIQPVRVVSTAAYPHHSAAAVPGDGGRRREGCQCVRRCRARGMCVSVHGGGGGGGCLKSIWGWGGASQCVGMCRGDVCQCLWCWWWLFQVSLSAGWRGGQVSVCVCRSMSTIMVDEVSPTPC